MAGEEHAKQTYSPAHTMSEDSTSSSARQPDAARPARRNSRPALVRKRLPSPPPETGPSSATSTTTPDDNQERRPVAKRARKAVNCEPCRTNKLKCDRNRPCSSCELRGTVSQCFQDGRTPNPTFTRPEDPVQELSKIRKLLTSLEHFVLLQTGQPSVSSPEADSALPDTPGLLTLPPSGGKAGAVGALPDTPGPGTRGRQSGGLYNGATSMLTILTDNQLLDSASPPLAEAQVAAPLNYDPTLLGQMPEMATIDNILDYYFTYCRWIFRHVWEPSFRAQWEEYRSERSSNELVLATCCGLLALSLTFMHESHPLKQAVTNFYVNKDAGKALYDLAMDAESRYKGKDYSLEHLEFTVVRAHYLVQAAHDGEVTWALRGELISTAMSMGLHRDPSQWAMLPEIAERRRWLWWHVLSFERWQAFLLGRPLSVANHHFDTELPSAQFEPAPGMSGCTYVAALVSFRLAAVLGGMVDDALALRPVPYEDVQQHDRALVQWMEELPSEWEFSETQLAAHLRADDLGRSRLVVQAMCLRMSCYHIRLTLHRPYASRFATLPDGNDPQDVVMSTEIAISTAEQLLSLSSQYYTHAPNNPVPPGHLGFMPFQIFSAAMFTAFQLIAAPTGPQVERHHLNMARAMEMLRGTAPHASGGAVADQAVQILDALAVLWSDQFVNQKVGAANEAQKQGVLARVRTLAFPFHTAAPAVKIESSANNYAIAAAGDPVPSLAEAYTFGSRGTIMPDMSYSGHRAHFSTDAPYGVQSSLSVQLPTQPVPGPYSSDSSSSTSQWPPPSPHHLSPHNHPTQSGSVPEYWSYNTLPQLSPSGTVALQARPFQAAGELGWFPPKAGMPASAGTRWGAGLGFDRHEWTAFTQTMGPTYPPPQQSRPMQGAQQQHGTYGTPPP